VRPGYQTALRLVALDNATAEKPPQEYQLRRVFRWYSRTFHTPLHEVWDLPLHDILVHYFEAHYEEMEDEERSAERDQLVLTPKELRARQRKRDASKADDYLFEREAETDEVLKFKAAKAPKKGSLGALKQRATPAFDKQSMPVAEKELLMTQAPAEEIHMTFAGVDEFDDELDRDALGDDPIVGED